MADSKFQLSYYALDYFIKTGKLFGGSREIYSFNWPPANEKSPRNGKCGSKLVIRSGNNFSLPKSESGRRKVTKQIAFSKWKKWKRSRQKLPKFNLLGSEFFSVFIFFPLIGHRRPQPLHVQLIFKCGEKVSCLIEIAFRRRPGSSWICGNNKLIIESNWPECGVVSLKLFK